MALNNIEAKQVIERIAEEKQERVRNGGSDFNGTLKRLVGIWRDPSHALIELLQNADDTGATIAEFRFLPHGIVFSHDGPSFTEDEVRAVCSIDQSTKDVETHTGFMGIGFKAVFKLSSSPFVVSSPWKWCFSSDGVEPSYWGWILTPRWCHELPPELQETPFNMTAFWLPYNTAFSKETVGRIEHELFDRFDSLSLLFLRHIKEIQMTASNGKSRSLRCEGDAVVELKNDNETTHHYKLFRNSFPVPNEVKDAYEVHDSDRDKAKIREITLAFALDSAGNLIPSKLPVYTFLPTNYFPRLHFAVQGDFILDTQRSTIDKTLEWNKWIWRCVKQLLVGAIEGFDSSGNRVSGFKEDEILRYQFLRMLPSKKDMSDDAKEDLIQEEFIEPFLTYCLENPIVLTSREQWVLPSESVIVPASIQKLMQPDELRPVTGRDHFVHPNVKGREFLRSLGMQEFAEHKILSVLTADLLNNKSNIWLENFYQFLFARLYGEQKEDKRWDSWWNHEKLVSEMLIVKTSKGHVSKPAQVLLPPATSEELKMIDDLPEIEFVENELLNDVSKKLLTNLGVKPFDRKNVITTVILRSFEEGTWKNWNDVQLSCCIKFLHRWLMERNWKLEPETEQKLGAVRVKTLSGHWERADSCYFSEDKLRLLYPEAYFVDARPDDEEADKFLRVLGVKDIPRLIISSDSYERDNTPMFSSNWKKYWNWLDRINVLPHGNTHVITSVFGLDGWDTFNWSGGEHQNVILCYLIENWQDEYQNYLQSICKYYHYGRHQTSSIQSYFIWQLQQTEWLPTTTGTVKPSSRIFMPISKIRKAASDMVSYVVIPPEYLAGDRLEHTKNFLCSLGIVTDLDKKVLVNLIELAQERKIDEKLKKQLSRIYDEFGKLLEEESVSIDTINLLCDDGTFRDAKSLYWNDDTEIGKHFAGTDGIRFAWAPSDIERRKLTVFFGSAGVKQLSKSIERKNIIPSKTEYAGEFTETVRRRARYLYSIFRHHRAEHVHLVARLSSFNVQFVDQLDVIVSLGDASRTIDTRAFCDMNTNTIYTTDKDWYEIAFELCRVFGLDVSHASEVETTLKETEERLIKRLQRQGISMLDWDDEPIELAYPEKSLDEKGKSSDILKVEQRQRLEEVWNEEGPEQTFSAEPTYQMFTRTQQAERSASREVQRTTLPHEERMRREAISLGIVLDDERRAGRQPRDVSKQALGYDIESRDEATGEVMYIEVKPPSYVLLTPNEYTVAKEKTTSYYLYVVDGTDIHRIQDPANSCRSEEIEIIETRWKILDWKEVALLQHI